LPWEKIGADILKRRRGGHMRLPPYKPPRLPKEFWRFPYLKKAILQTLKEDFKGKWAKREELRKFIKAEVPTSEINTCAKILREQGFVEAKYEDSRWPHLFSEVRVTASGVEELEKVSSD
jgi:hypothetical protein